MSSEIRNVGSNYKVIRDSLCNYLIEKEFYIIDVGSNGGVNCNPCKTLLSCNKTRYIYSDPRDSRLDNNNNLEYSYIGKEITINNAISNSHELKKLYLTRKGQVSSLNEPNIDEIAKFDNPHRFEVVEELEVGCTSISKVVKDLAIGIDILKIDIQGHEGYVIDSCKNELKEYSPWIIIETNNRDYYKSQYTHWELCKLIEECGYEVIDIFPKYNYYGSTSSSKSQCRVYTFSDILWRKKLTNNISSETYKRELAKYTAFGKLFTREGLALVEAINDRIVNKYVVKLESYYNSGVSAELDQYIV